MTQRAVLAFEGPIHSFSVDTPQRFAGPLAVAFEDLIVPEPTRPPMWRHRIDTDSDGYFLVTSDEHPRFGGADASHLVDGLVTAINAAAARHVGDQVALHAALMCRGSESVLVLGPSGSGKSTTAIALARAGWHYGTDEIASVTRDGAHAVGFPKPITVKRTPPDLLDDRPESDTSAVPNGGRHRRHVPAGSITEVERKPTTPRLVLSLDTPSSTHGPEPTPMGPVSATRAVLASCFDSALDIGQLLETSAQLAARSSVVSIARTPINEIASVVEDLWQRETDTWEVSALTPISGEISGVLAGAAALVRSGSEVCDIDPMPAGLWSSIADGLRRDDLIQRVAHHYGERIETVAEDLRPLVDELVRLGVITS